MGVVDIINMIIALTLGMALLVKVLGIIDRISLKTIFNATLFC